MRYLHLEQAGTGLEITWMLQERCLREKMIDANRFAEENIFAIKQIVTGVDEGVALVAEHDEKVVAVLVAHRDHAHDTLVIADLRVDYDQRREGIGMAMVYQMIAGARELGVRAVNAMTRTNNFPANQLMQKCGFELSGLDGKLHSNHDVVKEAASLFWYVTMN